MLKTHTEVESVEYVVVDDIICNKCGHSTALSVKKGMRHGSDGFRDYAELRVDWGYYSKKDMTTQTAHVCEDCWDTFCSSFVIAPSVACYGPGYREVEANESGQLELFPGE